MKLKRLLLSIGIAITLLLGLMAGLRGVPVLAAGGPDGPYDGFYCHPWFGGEDCDNEFLVDGSSGEDWGFKFSGSNVGLEDSVFVISDTTTFFLDFDFDWVNDADSNGCWTAPTGKWYYADYDGVQCEGNWQRFSLSGSCGNAPGYECTEANSGRCRVEFGADLASQKCVRWVGMEQDVQSYEKRIKLIDFWTNDQLNWITFTETATDCVPIETLVVTGPVTGTAGQANSFKGTVSPPSGTEPIDWSWEASGEGLAVDNDSESYESLADLTWWYSGTKTVTTTACNCAGCLAVTNTVAITGLSWTPPFSTTFPTPPEFPPDCNCPDPSYFGILEVGHWINWLWCNLKCWILFFLDFLYWLWELLRWVFYTIANTFLFYLWLLTTSAAMQADMYFRSAANWVDESSEALGDLVQALIFDIRDKIHASMTKWADWVDVSFDELGDWLQESVYNVRDWSHITLIDFGAYLNDFFTNLGEGWAGSIINIRDWSYDFLTMVGDFFASWGTNLGDFLAESTYEFRDWTYESLTNLANFVRDSGDNIGNAAEDFVLKIDEWLYDTLTKLGTLLNDWATSLGDYLSAFISAIDEWLYDALTKIGETLNAWIRFIGDVLASFLLFINAVVGGTLAGIYAIVAAQVYLFGLILDILDVIISMMHDGLDTIIFILDLLIGMLTGVKDALDAQTKAELFQGEAFYFWRGLEFFESAVGDTPLAVLNSIAIGLMGFRLGMWTVGQVADFLEDIARY